MTAPAKKMSAAQRAEIRDAFARSRVAYEEEMAAYRKRAYEADRQAEAQLRGKQERERTVRKQAVHNAEMELVDLLASDEAQQIMRRLRSALCQFNAADFDVEQHIANVTLDALSAKRSPRNDFARRTL